jgi:hypothetical protein
MAVRSENVDEVVADLIGSMRGHRWSRSIRSHRDDTCVRCSGVSAWRLFA